MKKLTALNEKLFDAVQAGDFELAKQLVAQGADVNACDEDDATPLHIAAGVEKDNCEVIKLLVDNSADLEVKNFDNETPLLKAASDGNLQNVKCLIELGADVCPTENGPTILHCAALVGNLSLVKYIIYEQKLDISYNVGILGTPLHCAAISGNLKVVRFLLEQCNADMFARTKGRGLLPIHYASYSHGGHLDIVKYFIQKGVDKDVEDSLGMTPFLFAADEGNLELVQYFFGQGANVSVCTKDSKMGALALAVKGSMQWEEERQDRLALVKYLVETVGLDCEQKNIMGWTPLFWAIRNGSFAVVKYLIEKCSVDITVRDIESKTVFDLEFDQKQQEIIDYLKNRL